MTLPTKIWASPSAGWCWALLEPDPSYRRHGMFGQRPTAWAINTTENSPYVTRTALLVVEPYLALEEETFCGGLGRVKSDRKNIGITPPYGAH